MRSLRPRSGGGGGGGVLRDSRPEEHDSRELSAAAGRANMITLRYTNGWISAQEQWRQDHPARVTREIIGAEITQWKLTLIGQK